MAVRQVITAAATTTRADGRGVSLMADAPLFLRRAMNAWHRSRWNAARRPTLWAALLLTSCSVLFQAGPAFATRTTCIGPAQCCPVGVTDGDLPAQATVNVGVTLNSIRAINEHEGSWTADFYLRESWRPTPGFVPQTEIVNEIEKKSSSDGDTWMHADQCIRSRRLTSVLHSRLDLRRFPFDTQVLDIQLSDSNFVSKSLHYSAQPMQARIDNANFELASWQAADTSLRYSSFSRLFHAAEGAQNFDYATFSLPVKRHVGFYLTRFFLPLLVIVAVAFSVFWIDPEDLGSQSGIGVTCLLAAIAFQLAVSDRLPQVDYLTMADRTFVACYIAIALAILESVATSSLHRTGQRTRAMQVDRVCRWLFPLGTIGLIGLATIVWI